MGKGCPHCYRSPITTSRGLGACVVGAVTTQQIPNQVEVPTQWWSVGHLVRARVDDLSGTSWLWGHIGSVEQRSHFMMIDFVRGLLRNGFFNAIHFNVKHLSLEIPPPPCFCFCWKIGLFHPSSCIHTMFFQMWRQSR